VNFLRRLALQGKKTGWHLASRCCWNRSRPWHASDLVSFLVGLRTYQHPGIVISRSVLRIMRSVPAKISRENQNTSYVQKLRSILQKWCRLWDNVEKLVQPHMIIQGDSVARGPKLLSIKICVIEEMTWKFIYTYRERCKTGPAHNRCWNWSPFHIQAHWNAFLQILEYFSTKCRSWRLESLSV